MRIRKALVSTMMVILSLNVLSVFGQAAAKEEKDVLSELRKINAVLLELKTDIAEIKKKIKKLEEEKEEDAATVEFGGSHRNKANIAKLRKIKLPDNPSQDQIKDYIRSIIDASRGQNTFSSEDPQVRMLAKVGEKNLKLLLDYAGNSNSPYSPGGGFHLKRAIHSLVNRQHKQLVLNYLPRCTFLVEIILKYGWEKDAKEILIKELDSSHHQLPVGWIRAIANLNDPKTYDSLKRYFIEHNGRYNTYEAIQHLPGIKLEEAIAEIYEGKEHHEWEERGIAKIAIQFGYLDAMQGLVDYLNTEKKNMWDATQVRQIVLRHLDFYGSNKEIAEWLDKNEDNLIFDDKTKKFTLDKNKKAPRKDNQKQK